ncbi:hypothetical protein M422DRAFT_241212 [Sphaerobolus stellatus SS14]|nr:hypothetical protein M422DRAFT_241212 [Sphaerobolus stellatus SS14]
MSLPPQVTVLIVGAGPSGLAAAIYFKQHGIPMAIVDLANVNRNGARASIVHTRTLEVLETIGVAEDIIQAGTVTQGQVLHGDRQHLITVELPLIKHMTKFAFSVLIPQEKVESVLMKKLNSLNEYVYTGKKAIAYREDGESTIVSFEDGTDVRAKYIIGADGARSTIRHLAGIDFRDPFSGETYDEPPVLPALNFVLADTMLQLPLPKEVSMNTITAFFDPFFVLIPQTSVIKGDAIFTRIFLGFIDGKQELPRAPTLEYIQSELDRRNPYPEQRLIVKEVITGSRYRTRSALANTYYKKIGNSELLLVGDAAHVHTPLGGQGLNLGICDAVAAAEAIAEHYNGKDLPSGDRAAILARYGETRREAGLTVITATKRFNYMIYWNHGWRRYVRNFAISIMRNIPFIRKELALEISGLIHRH